MTKQRRRVERMLAKLGQWVLLQHRDDMGDIDGGSIQDKAVEIGLLEQRTMTKPCGQNCPCFENGDGPHECYFLAKGVRLAKRRT